MDAVGYGRPIGMDFRLLGPLEVADHERALALGGVKQRSLPALLLLHAYEVVAAERLRFRGSLTAVGR